jgi:ferredoxin--NADP+ reductase
MNIHNAQTAGQPVDNKFLPMMQDVTEIKHWNERLFSFRLTRPQSFRFRSGEFVMIGLLGEDGKPILRAYSIASPFWDEELEFFSIKVQDGPLTSRLQHIKPGDKVILKAKATGTLVLDALLPGKRLYMMATGTGLAPFASLIRDPETYEKFDEIIVTHTCREVSDLAYGADLMAAIKDDLLVGEEAGQKLKYYPTTTRQDSKVKGRITSLIENGKLFDDLGVPGLDPRQDRVMICGSMPFNMDVKDICLSRGFEEGANNRPGSFVLEKAFVGE